MRRDVFVYLSGPITPKNGRSAERNVSDALAVYLRLLKHGIPSFCPQLCGAFPSVWSEVGYETWMQYDFAVIPRCTHVLMLDGWHASDGAIREHKYAIALDIPVALSEDELHEMLPMVAA